jgi:hypothetical protein
MLSEALRTCPDFSSGAKHLVFVQLITQRKMATDSGLYIFYGLNPRHDTLFIYRAFGAGAAVCVQRPHIKNLHQP